MKNLNFLERLTGSLDNVSTQSFSARKLSAFVIIILVIVCHTRWLNSEFRSEGDFRLLPEILIIDYSFISILLGLTTFEQIVKLKNGNNDKTPPATSGDSPAV
jgi:hypothetical protein